MAMKFGLSYSKLVIWMTVNAVFTVCLGLFLALTCLVPGFVPGLRTLLTQGFMADMLPYVIFILVISSLVSLSFYYDSRRK